MPVRVLVTGATGAIGPQIVSVLHEVGARVRTFSLDAPATGTFPDGVEVLRGDVTDLRAVETAVQGMDAIVHLAALLHIVNPPARLRLKYEQVNVGGTSAVVETAARNKVKRVILFSTIAVYGSEDSNGRILTEDTPPAPDTYYAQTKLAAEEILLGAKRCDGMPLGVVLRLGAVYGPRIKGNYQRLVRALAHRRFVRIGDGRNRRSVVFEKDVAQAVVLAIQKHSAAGRTYNVTDGEFHTVSEIIDAICTALGRRSPCFSLPFGPVRIATDWYERAARLAGCRSPAIGAMIDKYVEDVAVDGSRIRTELGFHPKYDLCAGWRETVREMREGGDL